MDLSEKETRHKIIDPQLEDAGWSKKYVKEEEILAGDKTISTFILKTQIPFARAQSQSSQTVTCEHPWERPQRIRHWNRSTGPRRAIGLALKGKSQPTRWLSVPCRRNIGRFALHADERPLPRHWDEGGWPFELQSGRRSPLPRI